MATRQRLGTTVFDAAIDRMTAVMQAGHRVVVSFSGGKDSTCCVQLARIAAGITGYGPLDVVLRDEEIMFPGTYEYCERVAQLPDVNFHWVWSGQPIINAYNRSTPYWWVFDDYLKPSEWVRQPPAFAQRIPELTMDRVTIPSRFPAQDGKDTLAVIGLRISESRGRLYGLYSAGGYVTKPNPAGVRNCWPIYDWSDSDVWRAIRENGWDYCKAYDTLRRMGIPARRLRIAPPTMNAAGADVLKIAMQAWPQWFERVAVRCPGVRTGAMFGKRALLPRRRPGESWEQTFRRECLGPDTPEWIKVRAADYMNLILGSHRHHSTSPLPEVEACYHCESESGSWKNLTLQLYAGDPFAMKCHSLKPADPDLFRPGSGKWYGKPSWG
jgi:predicted phosphoadenosine phosphosulfate sulfurtransferase